MGVPHSQMRSWDATDVDLLLAFQEYESSLGTHGFPVQEATSDAARPNNLAGGYRYKAGPVLTDWAEKVRLDALDAYRESLGEKPNMNGVTVGVTREDYTPVAAGQSLEGL